MHVIPSLDTVLVGNQTRLDSVENEQKWFGLFLFFSCRCCFESSPCKPPLFSLLWRIYIVFSRFYVDSASRRSKQRSCFLSLLYLSINRQAEIIILRANIYALDWKRQEDEHGFSSLMAKFNCESTIAPEINEIIMPIGRDSLLILRWTIDLQVRRCPSFLLSREKSYAISLQLNSLANLPIGAVKAILKNPMVEKEMEFNKFSERRSHE